jgi:hypothetical protein
MEEQDSSLLVIPDEDEDNDVDDEEKNRKAFQEIDDSITAHGNGLVLGYVDKFEGTEQFSDLVC